MDAIFGVQVSGRELLLGKNRLVGWELQRSLTPVGELVCYDFESPASLTADYTQPESPAPLRRAVRPDAEDSAVLLDATGLRLGSGLIRACHSGVSPQLCWISANLQQ